MGDNQADLVKGYLRLLKEREEAEQRGDVHEIEMIQAKIEGIIFAYETYTRQTFKQLMERWEWYNRS